MGVASVKSSLIQDNNISKEPNKKQKYLQMTVHVIEEGSAIAGVTAAVLAIALTALAFTPASIIGIPIIATLAGIATLVAVTGLIASQILRLPCFQNGEKEVHHEKKSFKIDLHEEALEGEEKQLEVDEKDLERPSGILRNRQGNARPANSLSTFRQYVQARLQDDIEQISDERDALQNEVEQLTKNLDDLEAEKREEIASIRHRFSEEQQNLQRDLESIRAEKAQLLQEKAEAIKVFDEETDNLKVRWEEQQGKVKHAKARLLKAEEEFKLKLEEKREVYEKAKEELAQRAELAEDHLKEAEKEYEARFKELANRHAKEKEELVNESAQNAILAKDHLGNTEKRYEASLDQQRCLHAKEKEELTQEAEKLRKNLDEFKKEYEAKLEALKGLYDEQQVVAKKQFEIEISALKEQMEDLTKDIREANELKVSSDQKLEELQAGLLESDKAIKEALRNYQAAEEKIKALNAENFELKVKLEAIEKANKDSSQTEEEPEPAHLKKEAQSPLRRI